jgi:glycosyltransferase involved in cell wall biosynthesis
MRNLISIVTPSYNQGEFIEETICSVLDQKNCNFEYVIIDGGSSDNSVEIIKKYSKYLKYWISERDNGQVHAIKKGIEHCSGDIFNWLNSDDFLRPNALSLVSENFTDDFDLLAAGVNVFDSSIGKDYFNSNLTARNLLLWEAGTNFIQPGVWLKRELIKKCGGLDMNFHYSFDWDLYIRYLYNFPSIKEIDDILVNFRLHDDSKTVSQGQKFEEEMFVITTKLLNSPEFYGLHNYCKMKISHNEILRQLERTMDLDCNKVIKLKRLFQLIFSVNDFKIMRIIAGSIRQLISK